MAWQEITTVEQLVDVVGQPTPRAVHKTRSVLHPLDREWLAASTFCLVATSAADGSCDVSPKGDPAGLLTSWMTTRSPLPNVPVTGAPTATATC